MACSMRAVSLLTLGFAVLLPGSRLLRADDNSLTQNSARLEHMSDAEKTAFLSKKRRFDDLPKEEQERLRRLYTDLRADPDHRRLFEVLRRYGEWLKTLPPGERAKLLSLPTDQRVQEIKEIQRTREAQRFKMMVDGRLGRDDMGAILQWIDQYTQAHEAELLADVPKGFRHLDDSNSDQKKRALGFMLLRKSALTSLAPEDEKKLLSMISRDAQQFLAKLDSDEERSSVLRTWIRAALFSRMRPPVNADVLRKFFLERLDPAQREYLESLPRDQMLRELQNRYWSEASGGPRHRRPGRPGFGPPPPGGNMSPRAPSEKSGVGRHRPEGQPRDGASGSGNQRPSPDKSK